MQRKLNKQLKTDNAEIDKTDSRNAFTHKTSPPLNFTTVVWGPLIVYLNKLKQQ